MKTFLILFSEKECVKSMCSVVHNRKSVEIQVLETSALKLESYNFVLCGDSVLRACLDGHIACSLDYFLLYGSNKILHDTPHPFLELSCSFLAQC